MPDSGTIDIVVNAFTPREVREGQMGFYSDFMSQVRMPVEMRDGITMEDYLKKMDAAGI